MKDDYLFIENPKYFSLPEQSHKMYLTAIRDFPINDEPDIFGLPANAEVSYQQRETYSLLKIFFYSISCCCFRRNVKRGTNLSSCK
jgi:hypothetical protein